MSDIYIKDDYVLSHYEKKLRFGDGKSVVVGYCRVSTDDQAEEGYSLETQRDKIREACSRKFGPGNFHVIYLFEEKSGTLPYDRGKMQKGTFREGLTLAAELFEQNYAKFLAVYKLNRITRNARIYLELDEDYLRPNDVEIFSATEQISNRTAASRFFTSIIAASAESERDNIVAVTKQGTEQRRKQLYWFGQVPFGWRWEDSRGERRSERSARQTAGESNRPRHNIEPVAEEAERIKEAYRWYLNGKTFAWIANEFIRLSVRTHRDNTIWTRASVRKMLGNHIHAGLVRLGGELLEGKHYSVRIVDLDAFYAVQDRIRQQARVPGTTRLSKYHIFGEFTFCALCGSKMRLAPRSKGSRYECSSTRAQYRHPGFSVLVERADRAVVQSISRLASSPAMLDASLKKMKALTNEGESRLTQEHQSYAQQLEAKKTQMVTWCERFNSGEIEQDVFSLYQARLREEISAMESRLVELQDMKRQRACQAVRLELGITMLKDFRTLWDSMDLDEKRTLASYVIDSLTLEPDGNWVNIRLKLILSNEEIIQVPVRGRGGRDAKGVEALSRRELALAHYHLQGYTDHEIAKMWDISLRMVKSHRSRVIQRTGAPNFEDALKAVAPLVEARKDELLLTGRVNGHHYKRDFTPLQMEVLRLMAERLSTREIAERTGRSIGGIYSVIENLRDKLGAHNMREAVAAAQKLHLISGSSIWSERPTEKQLDVLRELAKGTKQHQAAESLGISITALKERMKSMFHKFGVRQESILLEMARQKGWVER